MTPDDFFTMFARLQYAGGAQQCASLPQSVMQVLPIFIYFTQTTPIRAQPGRRTPATSIVVKNQPTGT